MQLQAVRQYPVRIASLSKGATQFRVMFHRDGVTRADTTTGAANAEQQAAARSLPTQRFFPQASDATLVRVFFLNCATADKCELVLQP